MKLVLVTLQKNILRHYKKMYTGADKTDIELRNLQAAVDNYNADRLDFDRIIRQN